MLFSPKMISLLWNKSFKLKREGIEIWISLCPIQKEKKNRHKDAVKTILRK